MKIKKECFYDVDSWLLETHPELLNDSETHYLTNQLKLAREALIKKLEDNTHES